MPTNVLYPKVSLEMASGRISRWLVREGDLVAEGQVLFEIDDDKAAVEVDSPASGVIRNLVDAEMDIDVGAEVAHIYQDGEAADRRGGSPVVSAIAPTVVPPAPVRCESDACGLPNPTPLARRMARERGIVLDAIVGTGPRGRIQKKDIAERLAEISGASARSVPLSVPIAVPNVSEHVRFVNDRERLNTLWLRQGAGVPVVMIHGYSADLNNWRGMLAGARTDMPVLAIDLPAHGQSPRGVPVDLDAVAEQVEATLQEEGVGTAVIAGHSFGGAVAARLASRDRIDVRGLCLFSPAGLTPEINAAFTEGIVRARNPESLRPWLELLADDPTVISDAFLRAVVQQRRDEGLTEAMTAFAARFFPDGTQAFSIRSDLARVRHLVRVVYGRQDRILPFVATRGLPGNVALHALDRCGHMPHLEHPDLAMRILAEVQRAA